MYIISLELIILHSHWKDCNAAFCLNNQLIQHILFKVDKTLNFYNLLCRSIPAGIVSILVLMAVGISSAAYSEHKYDGDLLQ